MRIYDSFDALSRLFCGNIRLFCDLFGVMRWLRLVGSLKTQVFFAK